MDRDSPIDGTRNRHRLEILRLERILQILVGVATRRGTNNVLDADIIDAPIQVDAPVSWDRPKLLSALKTRIDEHSYFLELAVPEHDCDAVEALVKRRVRN